MRKIAILSILILSLLAVNMAFAAQQPEMSVYVADINAGETAYVQVTLPDDAQGKVSVSVNGQKFSANVVDGQATVDLTGLKAGDYKVNVTYEGSGNYSKISKDVDLKVKGEAGSNNQTNTNVTGNASGEPIAAQNVTNVTGDNATNTTNTTNATNNTNIIPAKKVTNNTTQQVKKPKKEMPKPMESLNDKNTGIPVLLLLLVAIGAVFAVVFRKQ